MSDVEKLAALIRRVDGSHSLGAGALAEALIANGVRVAAVTCVHGKTRPHEIHGFGPVAQVLAGIDDNCPGPQ